jgi:hypothetical protein
MSGWPEDDLPLVLAYVELEEGPRLMTNIDADPSAVEIGAQVVVEFRDVDNAEIAVPVFVLEDG